MLRVLIWLSLVVYSIALIGALASGNHHMESITFGPRQKTPERLTEKRERTKAADKKNSVAMVPTENTPPRGTTGSDAADSSSSIISGGNHQSAVPPRPTAADVLVGFALNYHHTDKPELFRQAIDDMSADGFNAVEILTPAFQHDGASQQIEILNGPGRGPGKQELIDLLKYARSKGMATTLMPVVLLTDPRGNEWRGKISPDNWDAWWASYQKMLDYFLDVAKEGGASTLTVGSELLSTEKQTQRWESIIVRARSKFTGRLSYSTNWDHYDKPTFWKKLDLIGINGYWNLTTMTNAEHPVDEKLIERWQQIRKQVLEFGSAQGKPVLLTEIGYPSLPWALKDPWNYIANGSKPDHATQMRGYDAFLKTWRDLITPLTADTQRFAGVYFYEWDVYYQGRDDDTGYGVRGKPTRDLLRNFLAKIRD